MNFAIVKFKFPHTFFLMGDELVTDICFISDYCVINTFRDAHVLHYFSRLSLSNTLV